MEKEELEKRKMKQDSEKNGADSNDLEQSEKFQVSENWAHEIIEDMDDFIESQGIYLRQ